MAEHMMTYANGDKLCVNRKDLSVAIAQCPTEDLLENVIQNPSLYNALIDAWSMRNFYPGKESGHDHFFSAFGKYGAISGHHSAEILAEVAHRAGQQNESYLEIMNTTDGNASGMLGKKVGWDPDLTALREKLFAAGLHDIVNDMSNTLDADEKKQQTILACGTEKASPGCKITIRYLYQVLRGQPPAQVFAQLLAGFEIASKDPRMVGINMVQPEDGIISMRDYQLHMEMVGFLHKLYPKVHISLHAGELSSSLVPPDGLRFHINSAVYTAHAERIGHGIDIAFEDNAEQLLKTMAAQRIMVEINLKSNETILGIKGVEHPISLYMHYHVPVALSTDDEGVLRSNLTEQYKMAILSYQFTYPTVKMLVRNSISYSFLPGLNLWQDADYRQLSFDCAKDILGSLKPSAACQQFLNKNEKANMQWLLENKFMQFESHY